MSESADGDTPTTDADLPGPQPARLPASLAQPPRGWPVPQPGGRGATSPRMCGKGCCLQESPRDIGEFALHYELHGGLLPYDYKTYDMVDVLVALADAIDTLPRTKQTLTTTGLTQTHLDVPAHLDTDQKGGASNFPTTAFLLHGAFPLPEMTGTTRVFANPEYVHLDSLDAVHTVTDDAERRAWLDLYGALGVVGVADIAPHFGLAPTELEAWIARHDYPWAERVGMGRRLVARTLKTAYQWSDASRARLARAYRLGDAEAHALVRSRAGSFDPPADPSYRASFHQ